MLTRYKVILSFVMLAVIFSLTGCGDVNNESDNTTNYASAVKEKPIVTITMENDEKIVLELDPSVAPNTVANFVSLVEKGFYDGLIFHRVIPDFMIQGGDPEGNGTGGADYSIEGEFSENGIENNLKHERGVISMARSNNPDSASSQFFIMVKDSPHLDGQYAAFGKVIEGMETVDKIVSVKRDQMDKPLTEQKIKSVTVDTKGFDYPDPVVR
ncbi:peptidylprolyl isomerase [Niallia sp. Krafla_26]|uniref:peptidylprolyl isomerase n=1 Tax=Niallia sp. Krafla_26 TaxID=3064703 RepID=UPI003D17A48A